MASRQEFLRAFPTGKDRVILALDGMSSTKSDEMLRRVGGYIGIAKENDGADIDGARDSVNRMAAEKYVDMLDWKLHDTPGTVRNRARNITSVGASLITLHTPGGVAMLKGAVEGRDQALANLNVDALPDFLHDRIGQIGGLLGITILTSMDTEPGPNGEPSEVEQDIVGGLDEGVLRRTRWAHEAGLSGVVCSAAGLLVVRSRREFDNLIAVVPGMTLTGGKVNAGQHQISTPEAAFDSGADFVVAGSAVTDSENKNGFPAERAAELFALAAERAVA